MMYDLCMVHEFCMDLAGTAWSVRSQDHKEIFGTTKPTLGVHAG
jgi:hypothetical protein